MELLTKLFGDFLVFVYHCFDRIVIRGYLTALSRPELVVHFFREIVGVAEVSKEALSQRTADYQNWVEAYARNHAIPIEWAEKGVRKEDHVLPWLRRMEKRNMPTVSTSSSRAWSKGGTVLNFVCGLGTMGRKEISHGPTQGTQDPRCYS